MEPSELPPFPTPEPPHSTPVAPPADRGMSMLLQVLFLAAFWPAVYITHEQTTAMITAEQKARECEETAEKRAREREERQAAFEQIVGRWSLGNRDAWIIIFQRDKFVFRSDAKAVALGSWRFENGIYLLESPNLVGEWRARIVGDELLLEQSTSREGTWRVTSRLRRPAKE
jgi:hypothetical protein